MDDVIAEAFKAVPRQAFVPPEATDQADFDAPVPIGFGQTNSQPTTVSLMLEWLEPQPGQKVLDVGSGSGWTSALLAYLVGAKGMVHAVEIVPELVELGRRNCEELGIGNVQFHEATTAIGWPAEAPYDRILVSASANELPDELLGQLALGGRMVVPVRSSVWVYEKDMEGSIDAHEQPGFAFVPLIARNQR